MPRKPGPMRWAVPPTPMKPGSGRSFEVSSDDATAPIAGYCTTGLGCRPVFISTVPRSWLPSLVTSERTSDRLLELLGDGRQDLADLDAVGRGLDRLELAAGLLAGLEVPEVHVAGAAAHPQDDEALVFFLELGLGGLEAGEKVHARDRQRGRPRDVRQKVPPSHSRHHGFPLLVKAVRRARQQTCRTAVLLSFVRSWFGVKDFLVGSFAARRLSIRRGGGPESSRNAKKETRRGDPGGSTGSATEVTEK